MNVKQVVKTNHFNLQTQHFVLFLGVSILFLLEAYN